MVATVEEEEDGGKTELDLGIEESIRRCEALLAMVPLSAKEKNRVAEVAACGSSETKLARTCVDLDLEEKLKGMEPEWIKNMGLLSSMSNSKDGKSSSSSAITPQKPDAFDSGTPTQEYATEHSTPRTLPQANDFFTYVSKSRTLVAHRRRETMKRECAEGSRPSCAVTEDWMAYYSPVNSSRGSVSEDHQRQFKDVSNRTSADSAGSGGSSNPSTSRGTPASHTKHIEEQKHHQINPENLTTQYASSSPECDALSQDDEAGASLEGTRHSSRSNEFENLSDADSQTSQLCFNSSISRYCEEAWECFDNRSPDCATPPTKYEVYTSADVPDGAFPRRPKPSVVQSVHSARRPQETDRVEEPENNISEVNSTRDAAELKPKGLTTNFKRTEIVPAQKEITESGNKRHSDPPKKLKTRTMASMIRLSGPRTAMCNRLARFKNMQEENRLAECSFKPIVGRRPTPSSKFSAPIVKRLGCKQEQIAYRKRARKVREREERAQCSFSPNINAGRAYLDMAAYTPIQHRFQDIMKNRDRRISEVRAQEERDLGITFNPELNPNSARMLRLRVKSAPTTCASSQIVRTCTGTPRYSCTCSQDSPPETKHPKMTRPKSAACTFRPEINPNTDAILAGTPLRGCDFLSRQQQLFDNAEQRKRLKQQELPVDFTFQPKSGNAAFILSCSPVAETFCETLNERCNRLSYKDHQRREYLHQKISENYYAQFPFHPQIDEISRALGRPPTLNLLHVNERRRQQMEKAEMQVQEEFANNCTFRPMITRARTPLLDPEDIQKRKQEREKSEEMERLVKELKELSECTFKPLTNPLPPKEMECVRIKGLGRHVELQELAKLRRKEQEDWEKKVFFAHPDSPKRQFTIPKPFAFHVAKSKKRGGPPRPSSGESTGLKSPKTSSSPQAFCPSPL